MFQLDDMSPRFRENVGQQVANPSGSRRYRNRDVASHMDVASQPVCDALSKPRRHTIKPQHEDQLRLDL